VTPSDPPALRAETARGPFSYTDVGAGRAIVAIHGLPGSVRDFRYLGSALEDRCRLVRLDMPGFGGTPPSTARATTLGARAEFVADALEALGLEEVLVIGHSMGGPVALVAALSAAARVRGLGLLASAGLHPHRRIRRETRTRWLARGVDVPLLGLGLRRAGHAMFRRSGFPASTTYDEVAQTFRILGHFSFEETRAAATALRVPTLTAFADDDPFIEPEIEIELSGGVPPGPRLRWTTGGHNVQKTHAAEIADALATM